MKLTYDPKFNIAYIQLKEKKEQVETIHLSESVNIDLASDGTVYGFELLNANEQLGGTDKHSLVVENSATGTTAVVNY